VIDLETYGWNDYFATALRELTLESCVPGRVIADHGSYLKVVTPTETIAEIAGALTHASEPYQLPKVGDWVALQLSDHNRAIIRAVLPRMSEINRKAAGTGNVRQVLATNVDIAFVRTGA